MTALCLDDSKTERCGFLWLKKRTVKVPGLTKGKSYRVVRQEIATYGSEYVQNNYFYYLILDDDGIPQLHPASRFEVQW